MQSKNYRLAVDENGSPFVLNSRGSIDFGYITEEMNLPPAPIRIAEGNENYGLRHMERNHFEQLQAYGFSSVAEFVEYVSDNFTIIKEGHSGSFLLEFFFRKELYFVRITFKNRRLLESHKRRYIQNEIFQIQEDDPSPSVICFGSSSL